jgi:hypothetical protein
MERTSKMHLLAKYVLVRIGKKVFQHYKERKRRQKDYETWSRATQD